MYKRITSLLLLCATFGAHSQTIESGVSRILATQRHSLITGLTYQLSFDIPAEKSGRIAGSEIMHFSLKEANEVLQLDFRQDSAHVRSITVNGHPVQVKALHEHLLVGKQFLHKGLNTINIYFIAGDESLNRNNDYLYALFVPDRARTVFPCFDQPDLKAIFTLVLSVPAGWAVLANARLKDSATTGYKTIYHFQPSDLLPTYLFSFTTGKFTVHDKQRMRFLYRETDTAKLRLSIDAIFKAHTDAIHFLEDWTGIPFPFQKIGFAAIPAFQFGGMEHPGEVQYNAPALFLDEGATKEQLIARSSLISHETAHMWFGDMVTMQWFNDVWMKEVFANFMADKVTEKLLGTEMFNLKFLVDHFPAAYNVDRTTGANAIRQPLNNLQDAGSLYGNIIYHKAPIMMRQLELLMGAAAFRKGVQEYLQKYRYGNAGWNDLITALRRHTPADLLKWNEVWVNRPGRPIISYQLQQDMIEIFQKPERGTDAIWPQQFTIQLFYAGYDTTVHVNMISAKTSIAVPANPRAIVFNADGRGYGLFPALVTDSIFNLPHPLQRATAYINAYENMLAGMTIKPIDLLHFYSKGFLLETNELNLRLIAGYAGSIFWNFLSSQQRLSLGPNLEQLTWNALPIQAAPNNKKILFKLYQDVYVGSTGSSHMYDIWKLQKAPDGVKLTEDDYTSLALTIALKTDTASAVLQQQMARVSNTDRKARLQFLLPALSPDTAERDSFFYSLRNLNNRRKEAWVIAALSYMNHPLRQNSFIKHLPAALDMLQEIQHTGDVFFPQNWLTAIFAGYQTREAWQVVQHFLDTHPNYNPQLKAKILQATDNLQRSQVLQSE